MAITSYILSKLQPSTRQKTVSIKNLLSTC